MQDSMQYADSPSCDAGAVEVAAPSTPTSQLEDNNSSEATQQSDGTDGDAPTRLRTGWIASFLESLAASRGGGKPTFPTGKTVCKLLIGNAAAGSVIGRSGSAIGEFQKLSRARIQLSRAAEFVPCTGDRVLLVSGRLRNVLIALDAILAKLVREKASQVDAVNPMVSNLDEPAPTLLVRLLVPGTLCGIVIGAKGSAVRSIMDHSGARVRIDDEDLVCSKVVFKAVQVTGTQHCALQALAMLLMRLQEEPRYARYQELLPPAPHVPGSSNGTHISASSSACSEAHPGNAPSSPVHKAPPPAVMAPASPPTGLDRPLPPRSAPGPMPVPRGIATVPMPAASAAAAGASGYGYLPYHPSYVLMSMGQVPMPGMPAHAAMGQQLMHMPVLPHGMVQYVPQPAMVLPRAMPMTGPGGMGLLQQRMMHAAACVNSGEEYRL